MRISHFLNERGYLARWEKESPGEGAAHEETYLLHTFNCPYAGVSSEHRELCSMDLELMKELVGQTCCRVDSLAEDGRCCTYRIPQGSASVADPIALYEIPLIGQ